jgi:hypothetical protein
MLSIVLAALSTLQVVPQSAEGLFGDSGAAAPEEPLPAALMAGPYPGEELVQLRGRAWFARMSGHIEADATTQGTRLSVASDIDLGGDVTIPEVQAWINIGSVGRVIVGWWRYENSADATLDRTVTFAGHTFTGGAQVHTSLELNVAYVSYEYDFPDISLGDVAKLQLGLQLGLRGISGDATISEAGQTAESRGTIPALVLGGHAIATITPWLRAEVEAVGIEIKIDKEKVSYVETFVEAAVQPFPWLFAGVGYKYMQMTYHYRAHLNFDLEIDLSGAFVEVGVRF